jgi:hypothetical protein
MTSRACLVITAFTALMIFQISSAADTTGVLSGYALSLSNGQHEAGLKVSIESSPSYLNEAEPGDKFGPYWWWGGDGGPITTKASTTSDRSGHFVFLSLEPGIYHVRISGNGQWGCAAARIDAGSTTFAVVHTRTEPTSWGHIVFCPMEQRLFAPTETLSISPLYIAGNFEHR